MGSRGLHGVARPAAMREAQDARGIELMAQSPAAARSLDDHPGIDENSIQIKQKPRTPDLHSPKSGAVTDAARRTQERSRKCYGPHADRMSRQDVLGGDGPSPRMPIKMKPPMAAWER